MNRGAPPWLAFAAEDPERERYSSMSPSERLRHFIDVCNLGRALLEGRSDRAEVLARTEAMPERSERAWLDLVAKARRARPSWQPR
jgi:hypothetical protein